jgi:NAD(P)-dependent dehydrogenase (short-subunit alcohol dehydrogenase family)
MAADLAGKVVVVTGAAGNLGRAVAAAFARAGAALALLDQDEAALRAAMAAQGAAGSGALLVVADAMDRAAMAAAAERVARERGRIDALCNLVGGFRMGDPVHATPPEVWRQMIDLNAGTLINAAAAFVPHILAAGGGAVVNVAAAAALRGAAEMGAYSAAKGAVVRLTESMSAELRGRGVNVNCVMPTTMDTPQNRAAMPEADPGDWVTTEAVADVILFLCSEGARAVHGAAIPVTGRA